MQTDTAVYAIQIGVTRCGKGGRVSPRSRKGPMASRKGVVRQYGEDWQQIDAAALARARAVVATADAALTIERALCFEIEVEPMVMVKLAPSGCTRAPRDWTRIVGACLCLLPVVGVLALVVRLI